MPIFVLSSAAFYLFILFLFVFALGEASVQGVTGWICSMPIFVLAARLCPKGMEATMYATIMSFLNLGGVVSVQLGAHSYFV
jgi:hypothetical protein